MNTLRRSLALLALALAVVVLAATGGTVHAHDHGDHELARQALQQGKVLPLRTVIDKVEHDYQGQVLKVEFEHDDGRYIYEIRLLQNDGRVAKLAVDAVNGQVLKIKRKEH